MAIEERIDAMPRCHKGSGQVRERRFAEHHQRSHAMFDDGHELVRLAADTPVVSNCDPTLTADLTQSDFVGAQVVFEVVREPLNLQTAGRENGNCLPTSRSVKKTGLKQPARRERLLRFPGR